MQRKPKPAPADLRQPWQIEQAARCGCRGTDDMCPCQNVTPWPARRLTEFVWLIEAPGARYLATRRLGRDEFHWTQDASAATQFKSDAQADGVMMAVRELNPDLFGFEVTLGDARPTEHGWLADTSSATDPLRDADT